MIRWYVNGLHVSTSDEELTMDMGARCAAAGASEAETVDVIETALRFHHENQAMYRSVVRGAR